MLGTEITSSASGNLLGEASVITIGEALCARNIATSLAISSTIELLIPLAQTRIIGSEERSICFLSSITSEAIDL